MALIDCKRVFASLMNVKLNKTKEELGKWSLEKDLIYASVNKATTCFIQCWYGTPFCMPQVLRAQNALPVAFPLQ